MWRRKPTTTGTQNAAQWWHRWVLEIWRGFLLHLYVYVWRDRLRQQKKINDTIENVQHHALGQCSMLCANALARSLVAFAHTALIKCWIRECSGGKKATRWKFTERKIGWCCSEHKKRRRKKKKKLWRKKMQHRQRQKMLFIWISKMSHMPTVAAQHKKNRYQKRRKRRTNEEK